MKRKPRHILRQDWSDLRSDIERVRKELEISDNQFCELNINKWNTVQKNIEGKFLYKRSQNVKRSWLWDDLKTEIYTIFCKKDPYNKLDLLINENEFVFLIINETVNEETKYWYYEGQIKSIISIIGDAIGLDEYYLVSKDYDWFLCTNHHEVLIGSGTIISTMKENEETLKSTGFVHKNKF